MGIFKSLRGLLTPSSHTRDSKYIDESGKTGNSFMVRPSRSSTTSAPDDAMGLCLPSFTPPLAMSTSSLHAASRSPRASIEPSGRSTALPVVSVRAEGVKCPPSPFTAALAATAQSRRHSTDDMHARSSLERTLLTGDTAFRVGKPPVIPNLQHLNKTADYAQENDCDEVPCSPHNLSSALIKARLSTGSANGILNTNDSLKSLLHLDQYSFFTDMDVQEAQLQVDTELLASLLTAAEENSPPPSSVMQCTSRSNILAVSPALPHTMRRVRWSLEDYVLLKQLHKGYASDVFQAQCRLSKEMVALKVYKLAEQCDLQRVQLYREIRLHSQLQHTNVVQFYAGFLEDERVVLVQEFAGGGDLLKFMVKAGGRLAERQAVNLVLQPFLAALQYLHTQPENVLLTDHQQLKLADFGLAIDLNEERANTRAGTLDYMAPEVLRCPTKHTPDEGKLTPGAAHYQLGADAWAVGIFAYELITGLRPFKAKQNIEIARNIIHAQVVFPESVSELSKDFISQSLQKHPGDRPTVIEMLHHPWVTMFQRRSSVHYAYTRSNSLMEIMVAHKSTTAAAERVGSGLKRSSGAEPWQSRELPRDMTRQDGCGREVSRDAPARKIPSAYGGRDAVAAQYL